MSRERGRFFDEIGKKKEGDDTFQKGRRMLGSSGTLNTTTPCAACKLLRRRCAQECPFSPYFSPHEPHKFASVHKVFGASNVSKLLLEVPENQRADAANSLVYEANVRLRDPVYGCMGAISSLQQQVQLLLGELSAIREEIHKYRLMEANMHPSSEHVSIASTMPTSTTLPMLPSSIYSQQENHPSNYSSISSDHISYFD
ncbi:LOB domain-containing protein 15 [Lathyrus oleraceus]|uniref:Variant 2, LOB domain-containing protein 15 n=1 Tax=Pisum sativum TaxID=3888 RepID=A0A9D5B9E3_PEA|nr:LOB domain-containing protein 15-like [Pisum sativum]KAI5433959.1 variant 2, LOB domain-containing protein 15 [Pisum sativum]